MLPDHPPVGGYREEHSPGAGAHVGTRACHHKPGRAIPRRHLDGPLSEKQKRDPNSVHLRGCRGSKV